MAVEALRPQADGTPLAVDIIEKAAGLKQLLQAIERELKKKEFTSQPLQFYSCFLSYSSRDEEFARRLYSRLRDEGIRVWYAPEDVKGGERLYEQIDRAIQIHDRVLLILSESSLRSEWVATEIRKARKLELRENRRKLFPIRIVDYEAISEWECFDAETGNDLATEIREYFIPDFSHWKDHDAFEIAFGRLLRDIKASEFLITEHPESSRQQQISPRELDPLSERVAQKYREEVVTTMLRGIDRIKLNEHVIVGKYLRYDRRVRNHLREWVKRIKAPLLMKTHERENFLIWGPPGSGKTFLIHQIAESLEGSLTYVECNLARDDSSELSRKLQAFDNATGSILCLLDEIDAVGNAGSVYEKFFSMLDVNANTDRQIVIVLTGSTPGGINSMIKRIEQVNKGKDLLGRISLNHNSFEIPGPVLEDSAVMVIGQIEGLLKGKVKSVEKLALSYILCNERLRTSARQLSEFVKAATHRIGGDERLRYDHLFNAGDSEQIRFYNTIGEKLLNGLVNVDVQIIR
jgi:chromosomal replication initiation ATPase DnaA